ncbi:heme oxygenase [Panus rudis PR-1116 ss-1]|nr:heme oxygenase [Panus rudis PR-1116 ss-1]
MVAVVDLSPPVATLLREGTAAAHEKAEHSQGAGWLTRGELDKSEYIRFLMMLYHVYDTFERALDKHASHPVLQPTYNPGLLARTPSLSADIAYLLEVQETSWPSHPLHKELQASPPQPLTDYVSRLQTLADSSDPSPLLAHAYVRYLGDLSGGQFIRRRLAKAYGLEDGAGLSFYDFKQLGGTGSSTIGDMKKIKEWYRDGMNASVGDNEELKASILEEANVAFELNSGLFTTLRAPSQIVGGASPTLPPLGEPLTPTESSGQTTPTTEDSPEPSSKVIFQDKASEPSYRASSVIAFIIAVSLAHFILVVGGFTGSKGSAKLEAFQHWLEGIFSGSSAS